MPPSRGLVSLTWSSSSSSSSSSLSWMSGTVLILTTSSSSSSSPTTCSPDGAHTMLMMRRRRRRGEIHLLEEAASLRPAPLASSLLFSSLLSPSPSLPPLFFFFSCLPGCSVATGGRFRFRKELFKNREIKQNTEDVPGCLCKSKLCSFYVLKMDHLLNSQKKNSSCKSSKKFARMLRISRDLRILARCGNTA